MTRTEWNALVARYTAALANRLDTTNYSPIHVRDEAVADALLAVIRGERDIREPLVSPCPNPCRVCDGRGVLLYGHFSTQMPCLFCDPYSKAWRLEHLDLCEREGVRIDAEGNQLP